MTSDEFLTHYHLLERVSAGTVETYHAQASAGAMVMVHFLRGTETETRSITSLIERLAPERRRKVIRSVEVDGVTAIVTRFILDLVSFEDWLRDGASTPSVSVDTTESATPAASPSQADPPIQDERDVWTAPPVQVPPPNAPGELTLMFMAQSGMTPPAPDSRPPQPLDDGPAVSESGWPSPEPVAPHPPSAPPAPPAPFSHRPGELTQMFSAAEFGITPERPVPGPPPLSPPLNPPPPPPAFEQPVRGPSVPPKDVSRFFAQPTVPETEPRPRQGTPQDPFAPAQPRETATPRSAGSYRSKLASLDIGDDVPPVPVVPPPPPPFPAAPSGPSEFTRIISSIPAPAPTPPPAAPAPAPAAPPAKKSNRTYLIAFGALLLAAIVFAVVFWLLTKDPTTSAGAG